MANFLQRLTDPPWQPQADIYRTPAGWLVKVDLAGVRAEDVTLSLSGSSLVISGRRRDWLCSDRYVHYSMEIAYAPFQRAIDFPCKIENASIETEYCDGMLLVHLLGLKDTSEK